MAEGGERIEKGKYGEIQIESSTNVV